jgi:hypothetical protein
VQVHDRDPEHLSVDGERFEIRSNWQEPGRYHYVWLTGPHPGYGFTSQTSDGRGKTQRLHEESIRAFLDGIDKRTGFLAEGG